MSLFCIGCMWSVLNEIKMKLFMQLKVFRRKAFFLFFFNCCMCDLHTGPYLHLLNIHLICHCDCPLLNICIKARVSHVKTLDHWRGTSYQNLEILRCRNIWLPAHSIWAVQTKLPCVSALFSHMGQVTRN